MRDASAATQDTLPSFHAASRRHAHQRISKVTMSTPMLERHLVSVPKSSRIANILVKLLSHSPVTFAAVTASQYRSLLPAPPVLPPRLPLLALALLPLPLHLVQWPRRLPLEASITQPQLVQERRAHLVQEVGVALPLRLLSRAVQRVGLKED